MKEYNHEIKKRIIQKFRENTGEFNINNYKDVFTQAINVYSYKYLFNNRGLVTDDDVINRYGKYLKQTNSIMQEVQNRFFRGHYASFESGEIRDKVIVQYSTRFIDIKAVLQMYEFEKRMRFLSLNVSKTGLLIIYLIENAMKVDLTEIDSYFSCRYSLRLYEDIYFIDIPKNSIPEKYLNPYISGQLVYFHLLVLKYYYFSLYWPDYDEDEMKLLMW